MMLPWDQLNRDEYVRLCYEIAPLIGFNKRTFIESGPSNKLGYDILAYRDNDILPGLGYPEKWLLAAVPFKERKLKVEDIEFIKKWADEPLHEVDYILLITPSLVSHELEDWFLKFNRFPIKKYKFKFLSVPELDWIVYSSKKIKESFFGLEDEVRHEDYSEIKETILRKILNFRSDLGIVDIYLSILFTLPQNEQEKVISKIAGAWAYEGFERLKRWNAGWVIIRVAKLKPELVPIDIVEKVSLESDNVYKAQAAHVFAWLSTTKPDLIKPEILAKLLEYEADYFIYVPVTKAIVNLIDINEEAFSHVVDLVNDENHTKRLNGARIVAALADENPMLVPPSIVKKLMSDSNKKISAIGSDIAEKVLSFWEAPLRAQFNDAKEKFNKKEYMQAASIFSALSKKSDFTLANEAKWWAGYCYYLERNYPLSIQYFTDLLKNDIFSASAAWWLANCYERIGNEGEATKWLKETANLVNTKNLTIRISPEKEMEPEEVRPLLLKRLKELGQIQR